MPRFRRVDSWLSAVLSLCTVFLSGPAFARGFDNDDFSLRFPAALSRFASYGDVAAAGGASAGFKWQSSINPAAAGWMDIKGPLQLSFSPQYAALFFDEGTVFQVLPVTASWDTGALGTIQPTVAKAWTNQETTRDGVEFDYESSLGSFSGPSDLTTNGRLG